MTKIIKCEKCKKEFYYNEILNNFPGGLEKEDINCPYCNHINLQIMTSGIIKVSKKD